MDDSEVDNYFVKRDCCYTGDELVAAEDELDWNHNLLAGDTAELLADP